jgi:hypothetical protein
MLLFSSFITKNFPSHMSKTIGHKLYLEDFQIKLCKYLLSSCLWVFNSQQVAPQNSTSILCQNSCSKLSFNFYQFFNKWKVIMDKKWKFGYRWMFHCNIWYTKIKSVCPPQQNSSSNENGWSTLLWPPLGCHVILLSKGMHVRVYPTSNFWKIFTIFLHILLKYNLGKRLEKKLFHFISFYKVRN